MKVGLIGFGSTGKSVAASLLKSKDVQLEWVLRQSDELELRRAGDFLGIQNDEPGRIYCKDHIAIHELLDESPVDAIVDFSTPESLLYYGDEIARRGITLISAISRYPADLLDMLAQLASRTRVIHSPNITLGVNFLLIAAKILKTIAPTADIAIIEKHFFKKPEVSGTAKVLAHNLGVQEDEIKSVRAGGIVGVHEILFGFPHQTVQLSHESISREAFGTGILFALKNLPRRAVGLFTMEDILLPYFQRQMRGEPEERSIKSAQVVPWKDNISLPSYQRRHSPNIA